jgi:hypothetical protein
MMPHFHARSDTDKYETTFIWVDTSEYEKRKFMNFYNKLGDLELVSLPSKDYVISATNVEKSEYLYETLTRREFYPPLTHQLAGADFPYTKRFRKWDDAKNEFVPKHVSEYAFSVEDNFGHMDELLGFRLSFCNFEYTDETDPEKVNAGIDYEPITEVLKIERDPDAD